MKKLLIVALVIIGFGGFSLASTQLNEAISRMNQKGLTKFDNATDFMATNGLRRDEASKFFVQYAKEVMGLTPDTTKTSCNFTDLSKARPDLKDIIKESCQLGLFQGSNGKFMPTQSLTNAQAITVLIRMIDGKKDETQGHFAKLYFEKAQELGIMNGLTLNSTTNFDKLTTRGDVGQLIYSASKLSNTGTQSVVQNTEQTLYPLDLAKNQKREIEVSVPKEYPYDYGLIFTITRDGENLTTTTKEKNEITGRTSTHKNIYRAGFTYKQPSFLEKDYSSYLLEIRYCFYYYEYIQEDFRCHTYYVDGIINGNTVSGTYHYNYEGAGPWYIGNLISKYNVKINSKSNQTVTNCEYKGETYRDYIAGTTDKIYHSEDTKRYKELSNFICFETETAAKRAGYKASLLNP